MKKISILILIFLFLGNLALFSQDGEEIDFLEKVTEPKKTVSKKSSNTAGASSGTSTPKKKEKKRSKKKRSKKSSSSIPNNLEETQKKNVIPNTNETSSGNNNSNLNGSNSGSSNTLESGNVDEQRVSASKMDLRDLPKPYWVNEEVQIHPNNLPGYTVSQKSEQGSSFGSGLSEILKLGEDKKKEENKKKVQEVQKSGSFTGFISEYKKPIIIIVFILLFALYRLKAGKSRGSSSRKSPVTINKMRRD
ncbi:SRP-less Sec system protein [Leptospira interrogans]|uniref:Sec region non-globular protein n=15 Tax=Leptospira interrogans TaxID=173 RepID=D4YW28_LEPIN|nr:MULTISPECIES: SRP-less Sec system protein [Leptospira]EMF71157.1 hypothetical protein LEP1GSC148_4229 [Leptospira interrogans serovar Canicola str. LT1962]EMN71610.1 hypothetical protein LEP1GSC100_4893 [Leptospira interrogans serovar Bataviae str. UI 08561]EMY05500.1 hypothetical protein LEP1GSC029_3679 [Leptospira interrogans str. 2002000626]KAA1287594.1 hypothetical protein C4X99_24105 [Leptospira interrogans serovar Geyaweera]AAS71104.1 conserved hypothetical protein [Leptospira interro